MTITGPQIRGARSMLGLTQKEVALRSEVSEPTVKRLENQTGALSGHTTTIAAIVRALESAGVVFLDDGAQADGGPGVRLRKERPE